MCLREGKLARTSAGASSGRFPVPVLRHSNCKYQNVCMLLSPHRYPEGTRETVYRNKQKDEEEEEEEGEEEKKTKGDEDEKEEELLKRKWRGTDSSLR